MFVVKEAEVNWILTKLYIYSNTAKELFPRAIEAKETP